MRQQDTTDFGKLLFVFFRGKTHEEQGEGGLEHRVRVLLPAPVSGAVQEIRPSWPEAVQGHRADQESNKERAQPQDNAEKH